MSNFKVTQQKIDALLTELRAWDVDEERHTVRELARMFSLDVFIVQRIATSEDMDIPLGGNENEAEGPEHDPNASTMDLDPEEVQEAMEVPDPNYQDADSGVWEKKPTGEWELNKKKS